MESAPAAAIEILAEVSRADGSAGWTTLIGTGAPAFTAWLDPAVALDLFGAEADFTGATVFSPTGRATPNGDGRFDVSGRWPFSSGCRHAEWFLNGMFVFDGDAPRILPDRGPDWRLAFFPAPRARSSRTGTCSDCAAPEATTSWRPACASPTSTRSARSSKPPRQEGPLWRLPFFTLAGVALVGFPLGVGRRALDELAALAPAKARAGTFEVLAQDPAVQVELARAEGRLQAVRAFVFDAIGSVWDTACSGDVPSVAQRARFQLAAQEAMHAAIAAVDTAFALAGASAVHTSHPLQRCFRDLHTAAQHAYFSPTALKRYAKIHLGIDEPTFML